LICALVLDFLRERIGAPVREHDLIRYLDDHQCFAAFQTEPANLQLFRKHFITRHCLYSLQENLDALWQLQMDAIEICLRAAEEGATTQLSVSAVGVRDYYLDLDNLAQADEQSVSALLKTFWTRFASAGVSPEAFQVLGVDTAATWAEVQSAYRRKAQRTHPDQGGSAAAFAEVQEAYAVLRNHFNK